MMKMSRVQIRAILVKRIYQYLLAKGHPLQQRREQVNPDNGNLHEDIIDVEKVDAAGPSTAEVEKMKKSVYEQRHGAALPPHWPRFTEGQELKPVKGFMTVIDSVNLATQRIVVRLEKR